MNTVPATVSRIAQTAWATTAWAGVWYFGWMRQRAAGKRPSRAIAK